jgi:hypothetical protein
MSPLGSRLLAWWLALCEARANIDDYTDEDALQGSKHLMRALSPLVVPSHGRVETTRFTLDRSVQDLIRYGYLFPEDPSMGEVLISKEMRYSKRALLLSPKGLRACTTYLQRMLQEKYR